MEGVKNDIVKHLYLLRHAKSNWDDPALSDRDRPLAPRGRKAAAALAGHIARTGISPSLVLCSPARRTMDTLRLISGAFADGVEILVEEELYGAGSGELLRRLRKVPPRTPSVMVIGHNPAVHELALTLARSVEDLNQLKSKFPTGALASLAVPGAWKDLGAEPADLQEFVLPRELSSPDDA
jgi:phosphohistidine phosphatase